MNGKDEVTAIVGGGPAGSLAAERLASRGHKVLLIEEKPAWEKPCGGGITAKALLRYPFLADAEVERNWVGNCELISPSGRRVTLTLNQRLAIFSRHVLNGLMMDRARQAGVELCNDRVIHISGQAGDWHLETLGGTKLRAAFVIIATGARNPFRSQFSRPFAPGEMMLAMGYFIPGTSDRLQVRFVPRLEGYIWTFPRCDHFSAGICGKLDGHTAMDMRHMLEDFLTGEGFDWRGGRFYSHLLPSPTANTLAQAPCCGEGWGMVGDAAGFVDPITGEGLYYAFRSAELLTDAILAGNPAAYQTLLQQDLLPELIAATGYTARFFRGKLFGQPVLERMVQFIGESKKFRELVCDLFAGAQAYVTLRGRCYRQLLPTLWDALAT